MSANPLARARSLTASLAATSKNVNDDQLLYEALPGPAARPAWRSLAASEQARYEDVARELRASTIQWVLGYLGEEVGSSRARAAWFLDIAADLSDLAEPEVQP